MPNVTESYSMEESRKSKDVTAEIQKSVLLKEIARLEV